MNRLLYFIKKESLHILRDIRTLLVVIGIPILLMLLFGFAISTDVNNINVAVCAPVRAESIEKVISEMDNSELFTFKGYVNPDEIDRALRSGKVGIVVVFADDYDRIVSGRIPDEKAVQIVLDGSNPNVAASGAAYLTAMLGGMGSEAGLVENHILYNPQMKSAYNFVPGILGLIFILVCAMMTSISIVREKELGTMEVLLVSPVKPIWIILSKMVPYFLLSCINLISTLLIAKFALGVPMTGSIFGIIFISLTYILLSLGFGLLVSTVTDKQMVALLISGMILMLPIMMFSGMLFPVENLPAVLKPFSYIVPARWYIDAMRKLMIEGLEFSGVILEFSILCFMTVGILRVALMKFNDRLE
ncbi:MAG: ABC transporter permease [Bacteroidales bacterium]|nr:ABC transporter permease [Bacteroidales bacterium]MBQ2917842.1 ABC transporter permease [Bacteroidales bacterium]